MQTKQLQAALFLAKRGFFILPISPEKEGQILLPGKKYGKDPYDSATTDPSTIQEWWQQTPNANPAIAGGKGHVVIDIDIKSGKNGLISIAELEKELGPLPPTFTQLTPSGGEHRIYISPPIPSMNDFRPGIDIKGTHGFVYAVGSERKKYEGKSYKLKSETIKELPQKWIDFLIQKQVKSTPILEPIIPSNIDQEKAIELAKSYLQTAPEAIEGQSGDATTYVVAAKLKDFGVSQQNAFTLLSSPLWYNGCGWTAEDLQTKIKNAYQYGKNPIGIDNPSAIFSDLTPPVVSDVKSQSLFRSIQTLVSGGSFDDGLVDRILSKQSVAMLVGPSNVGKTFLTLDLGFAIATGKPWLTEFETDKGAVVYIGLETSDQDLAARKSAYLSKHPETDLSQFYFSAEPYDLSSPQSPSWQKLLPALESIHRQSPLKLIIIDTFAKALGGHDENSANEAGAFIKACDKLRSTFSCAVLFVHHFGKDKDKGARGSSAIFAGVDTEISVRRKDRSLELQITKQRLLMPLEYSIPYALKTVEVGKTPKGKIVTSCFVERVAMGSGEGFGVVKESPPVEAAAALESEGAAYNPRFEVLKLVLEAFQAGDNPEQPLEEIDAEALWTKFKAKLAAEKATMGGELSEGVWKMSKSRAAAFLEDHGYIVSRRSIRKAD